MKPTQKFSLKNIPDRFWKRLAILLNDSSLDSFHGMRKVRHILNYYKFALFIICIFLYFIGYNIYRHITHKDVVLYTALVNVVTGEDLTGQLGEDFTAHLGLDPSKNETVLYTGLYLTDDELNAYHEYTYASRMKILAALEGQIMDIVLMNREAFDAFSQNEYLCDLDRFLMDNDPALHEKLEPYLVSNIVILEDNADDLALDNSLEYIAVTEEHLYGLDISEMGPIGEAGFGETVYLGIIGNTPRAEAVIAYLHYLTD